MWQPNPVVSTTGGCPQRRRGAGPGPLTLNGDSRRPATRPWPLWSRIPQPRCAEPKNPPRCLRDVPTERCPAAPRQSILGPGGPGNRRSGLIATESRYVVGGGCSVARSGLQRRSSSPGDATIRPAAPGPVRPASLFTCPFNRPHAPAFLDARPVSAPSALRGASRRRQARQSPVSRWRTLSPRRAREPNDLVGVSSSGHFSPAAGTWRRDLSWGHHCRQGDRRGPAFVVASAALCFRHGSYPGRRRRRIRNTERLATAWPASHHVQACATETDALSALGPRRIDLVITEYRLPDGSGLDLLQRIKATSRALPVIMLTAFGIPSGRVRGRSSLVFGITSSSRATHRRSSGRSD